VSRIGRQPIAVPSGVEVDVDGQRVRVHGPRGELQRELPAEVSVVVDGTSVRVERRDDSRRARAMHGLARTLVANMVQGVAQGYEKTLEIVGTGYRAQARGSEELELALGFSHPVVVRAPEGIAFATPTQQRVVVSGIDKELVGQVAANIRRIRKPEPYKGKGVRYLGERVIRKAGKAGK
jgi:large subunit ribosomal protein L6